MIAGRPASASEEKVVPSSVVALKAGSGCPISGDGTSRGSRPRPVKSSQPSGTRTTGSTSQRRVGREMGEVIGQAPVASEASTASRRRSGQMAKSAPSATMAPPAQIQETSGLMRTWRLTVLVDGL